MTKTIPVKVSEIERWRYGAVEWAPLENAPEKFRSIPIGTFEAFYMGSWRFCRGSYMSDDGAMVWVEAASDCAKA